MTDLLQRLRLAESGSRELDAAILCAVLPETYKAMPGDTKCVQKVSSDGSRSFLHEFSSSWTYPSPTASIDAALALVEEVLPGKGWSLQTAGDFGHGATIDADIGDDPFVQHKSPAIAICLALLSALNKEQSDG